MLLPRFDFHETTTVEDACRLMAQFGINAKPLAGGTDLLVNMKQKMFHRRIWFPFHGSTH